MAFEYKVDIVRTSLIGDKMDSGGIEKLLNERGKDGWQFRTMTNTTVKGRIGPGGTDGLMVIFERARS